MRLITFSAVIVLSFVYPNHSQTVADYSIHVVANRRIDSERRQHAPPAAELLAATNDPLTDASAWALRLLREVGGLMEDWEDWEGRERRETSEGRLGIERKPLSCSLYSFAHSIRYSLPSNRSIDLSGPAGRRAVRRASTRPARAHARR
jgi:hypothetical protein